MPRPGTAGTSAHATRESKKTWLKSRVESNRRIVAAGIGRPIAVETGVVVRVGIAAVTEAQGLILIKDEGIVVLKVRRRLISTS
jgi:hypothetical protein